MSNKHSPGPWAVSSRRNTVVLDANGYLVAKASIRFDAPDGDVSLIAAAPELLEAAKAARDVLATAIRANWEGATDDDVAGHVTIKRLDAAIAKATGSEA